MPIQCIVVCGYTKGKSLGRGHRVAFAQEFNWLCITAATAIAICEVRILIHDYYMYHSLVPSPTPSFSSLLSTVKHFTVLSSDEKLGVGLGMRLVSSYIIIVHGTHC